MQTMTIPNATTDTSASAQAYRSRVCEDPVPGIDFRALARLDFGLFQALCRLGTSRERICAALNISYSDFDHLQQLTDS
jgi:hypothetical protein